MNTFKNNFRTNPQKPKKIQASTHKTKVRVHQVLVNKVVLENFQDEFKTKWLGRGVVLVDRELLKGCLEDLSLEQDNRCSY